MHIRGNVVDAHELVEVDFSLSLLNLLLVQAGEGICEHTHNVTVYHNGHEHKQNGEDQFSCVYANDVSVPDRCQHRQNVVDRGYVLVEYRVVLEVGCYDPIPVLVEGGDEVPDASHEMDQNSDEAHELENYDVVGIEFEEQHQVLQNPNLHQLEHFERTRQFIDSGQTRKPQKVIVFRHSGPSLVS